MSYFTVLAYPADDPLCSPDVIRVDHSFTHQGADFANDYEDCLAAAKENNPEEWNIGDVYKRLLDRNWSLSPEEHVLEVQY